MKINHAWIAVRTRYHSFFIRDGYKKLKASEWGFFFPLPPCWDHDNF